MRAWRTPLVGAVALTIAATPIAPVAAAPAAPMPASVAKAEAGSTVTQVHRRGHRWHHHHHRHRHRGLGVGIGLGVIGGIIAADAYGPGYVYDEEVVEAPPADTGDPRVQCAEKFRSFEWKTGLYTINSGEKKLCPYLK